MAILAQRFAALDKETNVAVANFLKVNDNGIYSKLSAGADLVKMEAANILNNPKVLGLKNSIDSLLASSSAELSNLSSIVTSSLSKVVSAIKLPSDLFALAKDRLTSFGGTINKMVQSAMNLGKKILCPITGIFDFLSGLFKFKNMSLSSLLGSFIKTLKKINKNLCSGSGASFEKLLKTPTLNEMKTKVNNAGKTVLASSGLGLLWDSAKIPKDLLSVGANVVKYTKVKADEMALKDTILPVNKDEVLDRIDSMMLA